MISRVKLEYEDVIHTSLAPAIDVDTKQTKRYDNKKPPSIHSQCRLPVLLRPPVNHYKNEGRIYTYRHIPVGKETTPPVIDYQICRANYLDTRPNLRSTRKIRHFLRTIFAMKMTRNKLSVGSISSQEPKWEIY